MEVICRRKYQVVESETEASISYTIPDGQSLALYKIYGSGGCDHNTLIKLDFDGTIIFATHGDYFELDKECICEHYGDGTKELTLTLRNDTANSETMGGGFRGVLS